MSSPLRRSAKEGSTCGERSQESGSTGRAYRRLASHPFGAIVDSGPVWSPDGRRLAYIRQRKWRPPKNKPAPPVNPTTEALDLVVASRSGRKRVIPLGGDDTDPRWSPDGRRIAFVHQVGRSRYQLWTVAPDGRDVRRLATGLRGPRNPAWSPDGRQIALTAIAADNRPHLFVVDAAGRARQVPVTGLVAEIRPTWSPDGKLLAFADYDGHVNVIAPDGSGQRTLATLAGADFFELDVVPRRALDRARRGEARPGGLASLVSETNKTGWVGG